MKIVTLAKSAGFCFGVRRAIGLALDTSDKHRNVYMLGDIVHNPHVVKDIKKSGIKKIDDLKKNKSAVLIIRAHGAPRQVYRQAKLLGYIIIDATCPMVKEIQSIAKKYEAKKYSIIIIGDKKHDEVIGIKGNLKTRPVIITKEAEVVKNRLKKIKKAVVVVQSTQNLEKAQAIVKKIRHYVKKLLFFNTICHPTRQKQKEILQLPKSQDVMIIIGAKNSANTKRLYELSHTINPNTYWVSSKREIRKKWFKNKNRIGIAAGASTPDYIIKEIQSYIKTL